MDHQPFLTVVTRACCRPKMLGINIKSLLAQTDWDIEQIYILDKNQRGIVWANCQLGMHAGRADGRYVYILDDDCKLIDAQFVTQLREVVVDEPDLVMVRSYRRQLPINELPTVWGDKSLIKQRTTNCLCYVVRGDLYRKHSIGFGEPVCGDWHFLKRLLRRGAEPVWLDRFVAETQQLGRGRRFEKCGKDWFRDVAEKYGIEQVVQDDWRLRLWRRSLS